MRPHRPLPRGDVMDTNALNAAMPFGSRLGIELVSVAGRGGRTARVGRGLSVRPGGVLHGAIMSLADSGGGLCAFLNLPEDAKGTATIESKTNFFGAVREGHVRDLPLAAQGQGDDRRRDGRPRRRWTPRRPRHADAGRPPLVGSARPGESGPGQPDGREPDRQPTKLTGRLGVDPVPPSGVEPAGVDPVAQEAVEPRRGDDSGHVVVVEAKLERRCSERRARSNRRRPGRCSRRRRATSAQADS